MTLKLAVTRPRVAVSAFALLLALSGGPAVVHADDEDTARMEAAEACSDASLHGIYGFSFQGAILKPDGTRAAEFAGVADEMFDGNGRITSGRLIEVFGGQPDTLTFTGTYSVNADCTGTKTVTLNGRPTHYAMILVEHGRAIQTAETDPGTLLAFTQVRQ